MTSDSTRGAVWRDQILCELVPHAVHRMGNLMTVIMGNCELLALDETDPSRAKSFEHVTSNARRAIELVRALGLHARSCSGPSEAVDLRYCISSTAELFSPVAKAASYEVEETECMGLTVARVDQTSFQMLILGLLVGAADAGEGLVTRTGNLRLRAVELGKRVAVIASFTSKDGPEVSDPDPSGQAAALAAEIGVSLRMRRHPGGLTIMLAMDVLA